MLLLNQLYPGHHPRAVNVLFSGVSSSGDQPLRPEFTSGASWCSVFGLPRAVCVYTSSECSQVYLVTCDSHKHIQISLKKYIS